MVYIFSIVVSAQITYMTLMDYYLNFGFILLTFLVAENAVLGYEKLFSLEKRIDWDGYIMWAFIGSWALVHVWWLAVCMSETFMRVDWDKMNELDQIEEDEFVYAPMDKSIGQPQSVETIDEWNRLRGKSVNDRKSVYQEEHPGIATQPQHDEDVATKPPIGKYTSTHL